MLVSALLACASPAPPPTIRWDGSALAVDDAPIGPWETACPTDQSTCPAVRDALRKSPRAGGHVVSVPADRPWGETARLLVSAADAGSSQPLLAIDGHAPVPTVIPEALPPGTVVTIAVSHDEQQRWIDAVAAFPVGATCADVYADEPDLNAICDGAAGATAPAHARIGGADGCLVPPSPRSDDPYLWAPALAASLAPFAGAPGPAWVIAADGAEPTAVIGVIASAAADTGLRTPIVALAVADRLGAPGDCADALVDKRGLDEAEARAIGASTPADVTAVTPMEPR